MRGAGNVVDEERLARVDLIDAVQIFNGVVRHAGHQVPTRFTLEGIDLGRVAKQVRLPLVRVAARGACGLARLMLASAKVLIVGMLKVAESLHPAA